MAPHLKCGGSNPLEVRVLYPPPVMPMPKILDLRKKPAKVSQNLQPRTFQAKVALQSPIETAAQKVRGQKPREEVKVEDKSPQISWQAPSFYYNPQKRYLSVLIVALLAGATALLIFGHDILTSIFLILSSLVLLLYGKQKPTASKITVNQSGIWVDDKMYYYGDLKSFWIEYNPGGAKELSIESAKWYLPYIKVLLNEQNPVKLRSLIINFLPEKEHENSLVDHIGRRLGL